MTAYRPAQVVAVGAGHFRHVQRIEDGLVVLVDEHDDALSGAFVQRFQKMAEPFRTRRVGRRHVGVLFDAVELGHQVCVHVVRLLEVTLAEAQAHDGMAYRPVPVPMDCQSLEQRLVALEQLLAGVEEQALAEAPRAREEVVRALVEQALDESGLVDVVAPVLANAAEGLDADGESASGHRGLGWQRPLEAVVGRALLPVVVMATRLDHRRSGGVDAHTTTVRIMCRGHESCGIRNGTINLGGSAGRRSGMSDMEGEER